MGNAGPITHVLLVSILIFSSASESALHYQRRGDVTTLALDDLGRPVLARGGEGAEEVFHSNDYWHVPQTFPNIRNTTVCPALFFWVDFFLGT